MCHRRSRCASLQRKALQAAIAAVGHDQHWRLRARVHPKAMRTIYLVVPFAQPGKGANKFGLLVVLIDEARSVTIADVDVAIAERWPRSSAGR